MIINDIEDGEMPNKQVSRTGPRLNSRPLIAGAALMGAGAIIGVTGFALSSSALLRAARRWIDDMETPPGELAKQKWAQTKAATTAGASAWHNGHTAHVRSK